MSEKESEANLYACTQISKQISAFAFFAMLLDVQIPCLAKLQAMPLQSPAHRSAQQPDRISPQSRGIDPFGGDD